MYYSIAADREEQQEKEISWRHSKEYTFSSFYILYNKEIFSWGEEGQSYDTA